MSGGGPVLVGPWVRRAAGRRAHHGDVGASSAQPDGALACRQHGLAYGV